MDIRNVLEKLKPVLIIIALFALAFYIRAEAVNLGGVPSDGKDFYTGPDGLPYFSEMDSYYNYRLTMNYINRGILGDTLVNGRAYDLHSYYPPGRPVDYPPLIVYTTAAAYRLLNLFGDFSLREVAFWIGAFIGSLCVIPAYLFVRRVTNDYGGIAAGIIVGLIPTYVAHTYAGFFDTDMFNIVLPLLVFWFFTESILATDIKKKTGYAIASALTILVFSAAWVGYIFYLAVLVAFVAIYLLISRYILREKPVEGYTGKLEWLTHQRELFPLVVLLLAGGILIGVFGGFSNLAGAVTGLFSATQIQATAQTTAYPNVYVSVSELQVPQFIAGGKSGLMPGQGTVVGGVGGIMVFIAGLLGVASLLWKYRSPERVPEKTGGGGLKAGKKSKFMKPLKNQGVSDEEKRHRYLLYAVLMAVWLIMSGYAVTKGSRFIPTFAVPLGLSAGIFTGFLVEYLRDSVKTTTSVALVAFIAAVVIALPFSVSVAIKLLAGVIGVGLVYSLRKPEIRAPIMMILVTLAVVAPTVSGAHSMTSSVVPGTDDGMWNSMQWIKKNTSSETVVMSWWDFGHLFAVAADRPVTFDGGSQNTPRAYWIGKALTTSNETLSLGILRMLSSSGDLAYETLDNYTNDSGKTAEILTATLGVPRDDAKNVMVSRYGLTEAQAEKVLEYSHPSKPKPFVLVLSSDMLGKAPWWTYFGTWDFEKKTGSRYGYYPSLGSSKPEVVNNTTVIQTVNTAVDDALVGTIIEKRDNTTNATIAIGNNRTVQRIKPHKLVIIEGNLLVRDEVVDSNAQLSLIVLGSNNQYTTVIMNRELEDSIFTKLFLLGGFNQTSFRFLHQEPGVLLWTAA